MYAIDFKDEPTGACWYRIGAAQGNAEAQSSYGWALLGGHGVAKDPVQAFAWFQKGAMQGSYNSAKHLSQMFAAGEGVPRSDQRSRYWAARAELIDPNFLHRKDFLPVPQWAADTSAGCESSNPSHADEPAAFREGRVAFEARAFEIAACWFQISQRLGSMKANVYLGILNMYGLGVPKNPSAGFQYMQKAADANDAMALMYLANFYRYGMGTKADPNRGAALVNKALHAPNGLDALMRVQGTLLSPEEAGSAVVKGLSAASAEDTCTDLNAMERDKSKVRDCNQTQGWFTGLLARPAKHTVEHPEEILPENFDFVVPGDITTLKMAAKMGLTR
jgi:TPR repeat protein